jgi:hypothetical protein
MNRIFTILVSIFLGTQLNAWAETEVLTSKTTVYSVRNVFEKKDSTNPNYEAIEQELKARFEVTGTGGLATMNQDSTEVDKSVLGVDVKGHLYASLEKNSEHTYLILDAEVDDMIQGIPLNMRKKYKIPMEYIVGSWEDYIAGKPVELKPTKQGDQALAESYTAVARELFKNLRDEFAKTADGKAKIGELKSEPVTSKGQSSVSGDFNRLELKNEGETVITFSFDFSTI